MFHVICSSWNMSHSMHLSLPTVSYRGVSYTSCLVAFELISICTHFVIVSLGFFFRRSNSFADAYELRAWVSINARQVIPSTFTVNTGIIPSLFSVAVINFCFPLSVCSRSQIEELWRLWQCKHVFLLKHSAARWFGAVQLKHSFFFARNFFRCSTVEIFWHSDDLWLHCYNKHICLAYHHHQVLEKAFLSGHISN